MMERRRFILLSFICAICFLMAGCSRSEGGADSTEGSRAGDVSAQSAGTAEEHDEPEAGVVVPGEDFAPTAGETVSFEGEGKKRISYTGNRSSVVYVTSAEELPEYEELKQYDDAFFEEHALILVTETVNSGSVEVGILSISTNGSVGTVTLYHDAGGGDVTTDDMATWLLWAEVEAGLDGCQWTVADPALQSELQTR